MKESGTKLRYLYVATNVGCSCESGYYVADGKRDGCHWALLFAERSVNVTIEIHLDG